MDVYVQKGAFPETLCNLIKYDAYKQHSPIAGLIGSAEEDTLKSSEVRWLRRGTEWDDLFELLEQTASQIGCEFFDAFGLSLEPIQLSTYMPGCCYGWNSDSSPEVPRRLSFSIQLDSYDEYEGGDLEFKVVTLPESATQKGSLIIFRSELWHRVTPVTTGVRHSFIGWWR
jgi:PKHD-type hydroxylase